MYIKLFIKKNELIKKYIGKFVSYGEKDGHINLFEDLEIINPNKNYIFECEGKCVGAIIRDVAKIEVSKHFGTKIKVTINEKPNLIRGKSHASEGKMVGIGIRKNPKDRFTGNYAYNESGLNEEAKKICDHDGDTFGNWLYDYAKFHLPWTTVSYEEFKKNCNIDNNDMIGAVFYAENYKAIGHVDNDRSEWAIGYVYEEGVVENGYFFYPEYGIAIKLITNSIWCWKSDAVHGTADLDLSKGGTRYTAAITLTEKTARAFEVEKGLRE